MTLGLGGAATVTTPQTGLNGRVRSVDDWLDAGHRLVAGWLDDPARWLDSCRAAKLRAHDFGPMYLEGVVCARLDPIFLATPRAER